MFSDTRLPRKKRPKRIMFGKIQRNLTGKIENPITPKQEEQRERCY